MNIPLLSRFQHLAQKAGFSVGAQDERAQATVAAVRAALPELLAVAVFDIASAQSLGAYSAVSTLNPAVVAACNVEVVKQKRRALQALGLTGEKIEDILITLREQLHLLRVSADEQRILYLVVNMQDTNLAIARDVLRGHGN